MTEEAPEKLRQAAILQLVSGLVNLTIMAGLSWCTIGTVAAFCTIWGGGFGGICGMIGCLLIPVGIFEVVAGAMGMSNPKVNAQIMQYAAYLEMGAILAGGIPSLIVGFIVNGWLSEPEVVAFLEAD